jgi:hypothetical protein
MVLCSEVVIAAEQVPSESQLEKLLLDKQYELFLPHCGKKGARVADCIR